MSSIALLKPKNELLADACREELDLDDGVIVPDAFVVQCIEDKLLKDVVKLKYHKVQQEYYHSTARFNIVPAGRRSGKTEIARRRLMKKALNFKLEDGRFVIGAPTAGQVKKIHWDALLKLVPRALMARRPHESEMTITLVNGVRIILAGMDAPQRIEGKYIDHFLGDEYGDMKEDVWYEHVRPCLSDLGRPGSADLIGVPEGRNHYWELWKKAQTDDEWARFTWFSSEILDPKEIASARSHLDPKTFEQEYEGSFVSFQGRCYYVFSDANIADVQYNPNLDLIFAFDFNVEPGVASVLQEQNGKTCLVDEVYFERDSNTVRICDELKFRYGTHRRRLFGYGDSTGGARGTAKVLGSDWDLIESAFPKMLTDVPDSNPRERVRINAVNSRLKENFLVNPKCIHHIADLEGVTCLPDGSIDKKSDKKLTHPSDAIGYYIHRVFPIEGYSSCATY